MVNTTKELTVNDPIMLTAVLGSVDNYVFLVCYSIITTCNCRRYYNSIHSDWFPEETPILKDLMNLPIPSWYSLGIQLGVPPAKLKTIQANGAQFPDFDERCTADMFQWWLSKEGSPTYRSLVKGLMAAGMTDAVRHVHDRYGMLLCIYIGILHVFLEC